MIEEWRMVTSSSSANTFSSFDPGFAALSVDEVLAANADIVSRIKLCYGTDRETFETNVLALIRRYAAYVHLLPATADNYFSAPGGLLRLGLEAGFFSLQGTDAHIFSGRSTISTRRLLEPRWRHATFIAGLCCEAHRVLSHMLVTDENGEIWSGYLQPLADWLATRGAARYFLSWRPHAIETRSLGVFALPHVVPPAVLQYLLEGLEVRACAGVAELDQVGLEFVGRLEAVDEGTQAAPHDDVLRVLAGHELLRRERCGASTRPVNLFVSSAAATYTLLLRRSDTPADTIVIRDKTPKSVKPSAAASGRDCLRPPPNTAPRRSGQLPERRAPTPTARGSAPGSVTRWTAWPSTTSSWPRTPSP